MRILVTGGTGFIGSHAYVELIEQGHSAVIIDNFSRSEEQVIQSLFRIIGVQPCYFNLDIRSRVALDDLFHSYDFDAVMHFAGVKSTSQSVEQPLMYYDNNVLGTINLLKAMEKSKVFNFVFSSSATVYGNVGNVAIKETQPLNAYNPYGETKVAVENMLRAVYEADSRWSIAILRYFNPIGGHSSGLLGDMPKGAPENLLPFIAEVACGKRSNLNIWGKDYPTPDGTAIRDYIHVCDLVDGHLDVLQNIADSGQLVTYNLGTGRGYSVLEIVKAFERANNIKIPFQYGKRRAGDVPVCFADVCKIHRELGWKTTRSLEQMCKDAWNFMKKCP